MASMKREAPVDDGRDTKKAKVLERETFQTPLSNCRILLNPADCDLDFNIEGNGLRGSALHEQGFAYCWSGARANVGITGGKYYFGCKIISDQLVDMEDTPLDQQHVCRIGISRGDDATGNLGETIHSFGYGGTGKFSNAGSFLNYGEKYGVGDLIICCVDLENKPMASVGFWKNGKWLGTAKHFDAGPSGLGILNSPVKKLEWESALFPHVLLKNVVVQLQFSIEDGLTPLEGYKPWSCALEDGKAIFGPTFSDPHNCEVMMMVGLPASGKTTWAEKWAKEHPGKRYILMGTNLALDLMKVPGLLRKRNYGERFDRLMDRATGIFNTLLARASKLNRNFIIDQTNVYKNARKRKLKPFANYRKIAVVVFPRPEELKSRAEKRFKEMGKEVPAEAVNEMIANFVLPTSKDMRGADEYFDQILFPELSRAESQKCLDEMKANLTLKREPSPYSHEIPVQSFTSPSMQHSRGVSINSYGSPSWSNRGSLQGIGGNLHGQCSPQPSFGVPHGRYSSSFPSVHPIDNSNYGSHSSAYEITGILSEPHDSYGITDAFGPASNICAGAPDTQKNWVIEPYPQASSLSYASSHAYNSSPGGLPPALTVRRPPMFESSPQYGSPYRNPVPRPTYGNFPTSMQHPGGYFPGRPGY